MKRQHKVDWGPGYRIFSCTDCGHTWKEKSRHCESESGDCCPECGDWQHPHDAEPHYEWPTDGSGNLLPST